MKLRHIFGLALAALLAVGCSDDYTLNPLDSIAIDQTYVALPETGGDATITINARQAWSFDDIFMTIVRNADGTRDTTYAPTPEWLTVTPLTGEAGETTVRLHAEAVNGGRETELRLSVGDDKQFISVRQGSLEAADATCAEVISGPEGKTYRVKGAITAIANTHYGNLYINDGTGEVYIYGTNDRDGKKGNDPIDSWGLEVGDVITVEGPKQLYNGTVELVDVNVVSVTKSLLKVVTPEPTVGIEGADIDVVLAYKGNGAYAALAEDCDWVSILSEDYRPGTATLFEPNPADTAIVHLRVAPNTGAGRKTDITFRSGTARSESAITWTIKQDAFMLPHGETSDDPFTVAEAIQKCIEVGSTAGETIYYAKGIISSIKEVSTSYGNATFNISDDGSDENALTCYRSYSLDNQKFTAEDEIGVGDEVIVCGKLVNYTRDGETFTPEFSGSVYIFSRKSAAEANKPGTRLNPFTPEQANAFIKEHLSAGQSTEEDYYIMGEIAKIDSPEKNLFNTQYGNATFYISEDGDPESETFYVYRTFYRPYTDEATRKWTEGDTQIQEGDAVVICGKLTLYENKNTGDLIAETVQNQSYIYSLNGKKH